jgi:hypothetical protein
MDMIWS